VPFRDLPFAQQFKKYQLVTVKASKPRSDRRPESLTPNVDSFVLGDVLDTTGNWKKRAPYVEPLEVESMCEIRARQEVDKTSLGMFRPVDVAMSIEPDDDDRQQVDAPSLFFQNRTRLERIPFRFKYDYRCSAPTCNGHSQSIIDWEIAQAFRKWSEANGVERALDMIRNKWVDEFFASDRDTRLFVGNMHQHPGTFLTLGVYYPKQG